MMLLSELATLLGGQIRFPDNTPKSDPDIVKLAPIDHAVAGSMTFLANPEYAKFLTTTKASAVLVKEFHSTCKVPQVILKNPYAAFAKAAQKFHKPNHPPAGLSEKAYVSTSAMIGEGVCVSPFAYVGDRSTLGNDVILYPGVVIGADVTIGDGCVLFPNVVVYDGCKLGKRVHIHSGCVVGGDGFGYAVGEGEIVKIPQTGIVVLEDDVELGANTSIDRAAMGVTKIKKGSKLDSQVQVGHNCEVGENCMLSAFTGLAGSSKIGNWVVMGGQSGVNGHIQITDKVQVGAKAGVVKTIDEPGVYMGFPAIPAMQWRRQQVYIKRLDEMERRLKSLEKTQTE